MAVTDPDAFKPPNAPKNNHVDDHEFLIREGLDLLASFRKIRSETVRKSIMTLVASLANMENEPRPPG